MLIQVLLGGLVSACGEKTKTPELAETVEPGQEVFENPVVDANFPDPTIVKAGDGYFYVYATNSGVNGKTHNMQVRRSKDLVKWEVLGDAMPETPSWGSGDFWAPHVTYDESSDTYFLYYSGESTDTDIGKCLGVAVSRSPEGPFIDKGEPLLCGETFVNIDPMVFEDPASGKKYYYWGSGHEAIKVRELAEDGINFKANSETIELLQPVRNDLPSNYENLLEGAWVVKKDDFYYLFYSGDNCCGDQAHYAVMVARATSPTGPFEKYQNEEGSSVILSENSSWRAPGHNSLIQDAAGDYWIAYHAIDTKEPNAGRKMLLDKVTWKNGWPSVNDGTPSDEEIAVPEL